MRTHASLIKLLGVLHHLPLVFKLDALDELVKQLGSIILVDFLVTLKNSHSIILRSVVGFLCVLVLFLEDCVLYDVLKQQKLILIQFLRLFDTRIGLKFA